MRRHHRRHNDSHHASGSDAGAAPSGPPTSQRVGGRDAPLRLSRRGAAAGRRPSLALPPHRATTRDACALYPAVGSPCSGVSGPLLGTDRLCGNTSFHFDIVEAYRAGLADNTNMFVLGKPGNGKSALVKTMIWRSLGLYGSDRFYAIVDAKGEYRALAEAAGFQVVDLRPGGPTKLNPLGPPAHRDDPAEVERVTQNRLGMVAALCAAQLRAGLTPQQEAVLHAALAGIARAELERRQGGLVTLRTVADVLAEPPAAVVEAVRARKAIEVREHTMPLLVALDGLLNRSMRGMFDGDTPLAIDPLRCRGLVVDLSGVSGTGGDGSALPLVMVAVTAWLRELLGTDWGTVRKVQVIDEAWLLMRDPAIVRWLQDTWKLGRTWGIANLAVLHRPSDLAAQTDAGSAAGAMAVGLLTDTDTIVSFAQNANELATHGDLLGWTNSERAVIARLQRGESLWAIGERHRALLSHFLNDGTEIVVCDTDHHLNTAHPTQAPDHIRGHLPADRRTWP